MNPSVTPTKHEVEGWLPMPQDVAGIVYAYLGNPFVTTWEVGKSGIIRLPITELIMAGGAIESLDFVVDWGDGSNARFHAFNYRLNDLTHVYSAAGQYSVHITGMLGRFCFDGSRKMGLSSIAPDFDNGMPVYASCEQLLCVSQWGCFQCFSGAFRGCTELNVTARDAPELKDVKDLSMMFAGCASLMKEDFSSWDTSGVTSMNGMFDGCDHFDGNVSSWSTNSVTDMYMMFKGCRLFNGDLSNWKTGCVTDMDSMFMNCVSFNGDLSLWATGNVTTMQKMFICCTSFQGGDLRSWDTRRVINMRSAFYGCTEFNGDLSTWITGSVLYMDRMFEGCCSFNGDLGRWDTSNVIYAMDMFFGCVSFKGDLSSWYIACELSDPSPEEERITQKLESRSPFEESRMQNIMRNYEVWRDIYKGKAFPATLFKSDPSTYYEGKRMQNIARNQEMFRDIFESNASPATSFKANIKRKNEAEPQQAQAPSFRLADPTRELRSGNRWRKSRSRSRSRSY